MRGEPASNPSFNSQCLVASRQMVASWGGIGILLLLFIIPRLFLGVTHAETSDQFPLEPPDTSSPRATMQAFLGQMKEASQVFDTLRREYYQDDRLYFSESMEKQRLELLTILDRSKRFLDLSQLAPVVLSKRSLETILFLKEIFDRIDLPHPETIPDEAAMEEGKQSRWTIPHTEITIAQVQEGPRAGQYLFSPDTLDRSLEFYDKVQHLPYKPGSWVGAVIFYDSIGGPLIPWKLIDRLPSWAKQPVLEQALWRWIVLSASLVLGVLALAVIYRWKSQSVGENHVVKYLRRLLFPVSLIIFLGFLNFIKDAINITSVTHHWLETTLGVGVFFALGWSIILFGNTIAEVIISSPRIRPKGIDATLVRIGWRMITFILAGYVILEGARSIGIPLVPLLAGLGVGGLALALAAQPTIENFIAGLTLYADRSVRIGETCRFGDRVGTVEQIGMRSTQIRTLDQSLVTVSNANFSKLHLKNYSRRGRNWYHPRIKLRYETTPDQIRWILVEVRKLMYAHPKVSQDPARIRFVEFGTHSIDLDVFAFIDVADYGEFLEIAEDLNLRIMEVVAQSGSSLAVPASRTFIERGQGPDQQRTQEVEAQVKEWKENNMLYLPNFPPEKIAELRGTLKYPPAGSPGSASAQPIREP
jgi:MscS family membrane protein